MDYDLPTEFDLIVIGTGVVESIVSAAASRIGKRVLQVDRKSYYGGHWASFNLEDILSLKEDEVLSDTEPCEKFIGDGENLIPLGNKLYQLAHFHIEWHVVEKTSPTISQTTEIKLQEKLEEQELGKENECEQIIGAQKNAQSDEEDTEKNNDGTDEGKAVDEEPKQESEVITQESLRSNYRKFIIDLCPKLQFARGDFVELLISSNIARYAEFRSVSRVLTWINGNIEVVPCSRSDVFANNKVSVVEKRMLMKLLTSIEEDEKNSTVPEYTTYKDLLRGKKLSANVIHFVLYALSMSTDGTLWLDGIKSTKRFLNSLGRFGKTPFLFSMYGSGEITQAFCRLSAVFGGVFALKQPIQGIVMNKDNNFQSLLIGKQRITAPHVVMDIGMAPQLFLKNSDAKLISRAVFITDRSLMDSEKEHLTLLLYPTTNKLITILELGTLTGTCPKNVFLIHVTTNGTSNPKEDFSNCVEDLFTFDERDETCTKPRILWSCYFSIPDTNELDLKSNVPNNIFLCPGPDLDLDYDFSVKKAREIFASIYPNEEFLPRAPDADEIVIGEDPETEAATEVRASSSELDSSLEIAATPKEKEVAIETSSEQEMEKSSETEVGVEVRASSSDLDTSCEINKTSPVLDSEFSKELEECTEAKENMQ